MGEMCIYMCESIYIYMGGWNENVGDIYVYH